jgi:hypothetical protein
MASPAFFIEVQKVGTILQTPLTMQNLEVTKHKRFNWLENIPIELEAGDRIGSTVEFIHTVSPSERFLYAILSTLFGGHYLAKLDASSLVLERLFVVGESSLSMCRTCSCFARSPCL